MYECIYLISCPLQHIYDDGSPEYFVNGHINLGKIVVSSWLFSQRIGNQFFFSILLSSQIEKIQFNYYLFVGVKDVFSPFPRALVRIKYIF